MGIGAPNAGHADTQQHHCAHDLLEIRGDRWCSFPTGRTSESPVNFGWTFSMFELKNTPLNDIQYRRFHQLREKKYREKYIIQRQTD